MALKIFATIIFTISSVAFAQKPLFNRTYRLGDTYRYRLSCTEYENGKWTYTVVSVCELEVGKDTAGIYFDEVRWISKKTFSGKDTTDQTEKAIRVKPYNISLQPGGRLDLPKIEVPDMTESIEDFNTFFVAISPMLGINTLKHVGDSIIKSDPVKADFSNGSFILKGDDCFSVKLKLTGITQKYLMTEAGFLPPSKICFPYLLDEMNKPVIADTINNFQMVSPMGDQKFNVMYGREMFYINTVVQRKDGKILKATMNNTLSLKLKVNCDKDYKNSQFETPFAIQRNLELELIR